MAGPDGRLMHAEVRVGDSMLMLGEPSAQWKPMPGRALPGVADCDAAHQRRWRPGAGRVEPATSPAIATACATPPNPW